MNSKSNKFQQEKINHFVAFTQKTEPVAKAYLEAFSWNLELACDNFYQNPTRFASAEVRDKRDMRKIDSLFSQYANNAKDKMGRDQIGPHRVQRLLSDLGLHPTDRLVLALAWKLKAEKQCEFSRKEFQEGMTAMKVDSLDKLKKYLPSVNTELANPEHFRDFYHFTFQYAKSISQKSLLIETAIAYWQLVFSGSKDVTRVNKWISFLQHKKIKAISRDTWNLFLDFLQTTDADLSNYSSDDAWPVLLDEFVDHCKAQIKNGGR